MTGNPARSPRAAEAVPRISRRAACGLLALGVLAAGALAGCGGGRKLSTSGYSGDLPDQEVTDFVLTETDLGHPQWTLYARYAAVYSARNQITARGVRVDFFDDKGAQSSELTAREGEIQQQTRNMTARGNVVLQTAEGTRMATELLQYDNAAGIVHTDLPVRVERRGDVLEGVGFRSDPGLHHFEFKSQVRATVRNSGGGAVLAPKGPGR